MLAFVGSASALVLLMVLVLQRSEALDLRWAYVDLDVGVLRVRRGLHWSEGGLAESLHPWPPLLRVFTTLVGTPVDPNHFSRTFALGPARPACRLYGCTTSGTPASRFY
jgi:integrase